MATKRIQLRGISRTPSDRMTQDGGCAESLNVFLDNDEIAPVIKPKDITESLTDAQKTSRPIYIHATNNFKNVIRKSTTAILFNEVVLLTLNNSETLSDISHIGNTLVISTNKSLYYMLFKDGSYHALGGEVPFPTLKVVAQGSELQQSTFLAYEENTNDQPDQDFKFNPGKWNDYTSEGENSLDVAKRIANHLSEELKKFTDNADNKKYVWPMVVRYAARLYDGSMITSVPFLVAPQNIRGYSTAKGTYSWQLNGDGSGITAYIEQIEVNYALTPYLPYVQLLDFNKDTVEKWKDVIVGIDVYFSDQITPEKLDCIGVSNVNNTADGTTSSFAYADIDLGGAQWSEEKGILSKSVFFKAASYSLTNADDHNTLTKGTTLPLIKSDDLFVKDQLDPYKDVMESHTLIPQKLTTFNNRLVAGDIIGKVNTGPKFFTSTDNSEDTLEWSFRFFIDINGEQVEVIRRNIGDIKFFTGVTPYSWIVYPDVNCKRVDVATDSGKYISIPMKEHPNLNCSYAYLGKNRLLDYVVSSNQYEAVLNDEEIPTFKTPNKLLLSELDNPIVFPITGRYTIGSGSILGMTAATKALSQGQFGQYPLYVFTTEGVWAMSTNELGTFSTSTPLSREICDNPDSITPLEQEVIFTSKRGVMLLAGSEIVELSPNMNGRHYSMEASANNIVMTQPGFEEFEHTLSDTSSFMSFISHAKCAYDYVGKKLVFINPTEEYQYVYKLDTQTWHKIKIGGYVIKDTLNSYPECYVTAVDKNGYYYSILNLSTVLNASEDQTTEKGVIASRPFDLDEPDVFKTITDIRVRGQFQKGSVNFILLGSNDGIHFYTISTLRGKSWKLFRIVLLSKLSQHERISWIDVQYETRFTNRLR